MDRTAEVCRKTAETDIELKLNLDGNPKNSRIDSGVGFLDHMLVLFAKHAGFELQLTCRGDTQVDDHHSTEDIGIALGKAIREALGERKGIRRYASLALPMDEALVLTALDLSGRGGAFFEVEFPTEKVGMFDTELTEEFFTAFALNAGITLHMRKLAGKNSHHIAEACFKGLGRTMREAVSYDDRFRDEIPSTKGVL
ncbi:MAG: imidazoleglycerol-phosphate dehydratase HisB [Solobacterium sp.]|nr:imidazoleglycerol-phosphate dehydratase HisB [Solobacterium sp.]